MDAEFWLNVLQSIVVAVAAFFLILCGLVWGLYILVVNKLVNGNVKKGNRNDQKILKVRESL